MSLANRARAAWRKLDMGAQDLVIGDPGPEHMFDDRVYKRGALALHALLAGLVLAAVVVWGRFGPYAF